MVLLVLIKIDKLALKSNEIGLILLPNVPKKLFSKFNCIIKIKI